MAEKPDDEKGPAAALPYHQRAIELDPNFAMGYWAVGSDYFSLGELGRASEYYTKAFQLREHASEREKLAITADYYSYVTGELDKAAQTYQEEIESYPREFERTTIWATCTAKQGQYEKAAESHGKPPPCPDQMSLLTTNLANCTLALQRFDEARQIIHEAQARKLDDDLLHTALYALAFLAADSAAMAEQQQWFAGKPEYENFGLALASDTEAYARSSWQGAGTDQAGCGLRHPRRQQGKRGNLAGECCSATKPLTATPRKRGSQRQRL